MKELTTQIEMMERKIKQGGTVDKAKEFDPLRTSLFELKNEQSEQVVQDGIKLMYKLGSLVNQERTHLRELYEGS